MKPDGTVAVVEMIVSGDPAGAAAKMFDLQMLVYFGRGRERSEAEFRALFERAGLSLTGIHPTRSPMAVIEAARA